MSARRLGLLVLSALAAAACSPPSPGGGDGGTGGGGDGPGGGAPGGGGGASAGGTGGGGEADAGVQVTVREGTLVGFVDGATRSFRGIPYAAPPIGNLRWAPPAPAPVWAAPRDATRFGSPCVQRESDGGISGDEDCLTLNVWAPSAAASGPRPVLVFIHGGGLSTGSGSEPLYEGADLAGNTGAVLVTFNYRLGGLGFLSHAALTSENAPATSGNYGMLDQIAALRWVHDNVAAFGGDPGNVTVFGESAGGTSTLVMVLSPLTRGLFRRAIVESGGIQSVFPTLAQAEAAGATLAGLMGCGGAADVPACLRAVPASTVIARTVFTAHTVRDLFRAPTQYRLLPVVDGHVLTGQPFATFQAGGHNRMPLIVGNTATEAGYFALTGSLPPVTGAVSYTAALNQLFGSNAAAVEAQYPASAYPSAFQAYLAALSDAGFVCRTRALLRLLRQGQTEPIYRYHFSQTLRGPQQVYGSYHVLELFFLFRTLARFGYVPDAQDHAVADTLQRYWGSFAATGDPNGAPSVAWPAVSAAGGEYLEIVDQSGRTTQASQGLRTAQCDFWDGLGIY